METPTSLQASLRACVGSCKNPRRLEDSPAGLWVLARAVAGHADDGGARLGHVDDDGLARRVLRQVARLIRGLDLEEELSAGLARERPAIQTIVLQIASDDLPD